MDRTVHSVFKPPNAKTKPDSNFNPKPGLRARPYVPTKIYS